MDDKGFTLLELQVSIIMLVMALAATGSILATEVQHLEWLETQNQLYTWMPQSMTQIAFTELTSAVNPSLAVNRVKVSLFSVGTSSITAVAVLEAR